MTYSTTSYPLDCPDAIWQAFKEVQHTDHNINDELVVAIAEHVDGRADDPGVSLSEEQRQRIDSILDRS